MIKSKNHVTEYHFESYEKFLLYLVKKPSLGESFHVKVPETVKINKQNMIEILKELSDKFSVRFFLNDEEIPFVECWLKDGIFLESKGLSYSL